MDLLESSVLGMVETMNDRGSKTMPSDAVTVSDNTTVANEFGSPLAPALGLSAYYRLSVNGRQVFVHEARVSAMPFNCVWPGHQRPLEQTEIAAFCTFDADFSQLVTLRIELLPEHPRCESFGAGNLVLRPLECGYEPEVDRDARVVTLALDRPCQFVLEIGGQHHALHVFANPVENYDLPEDDSGHLIYFGPGEHQAGLILPKSGQTVYLAEGAVVYGAILVYKAENVRILGRGILDGSLFKRGQEAKEDEPGGELFATGLAAGLPWENIGYVGNIAAIESRNLTIDGIILRDSPLWSTNIRNGCQHVSIHNIKIIGQWRYNADGINICSSSHVSISECFVRSFDDCVIARGTHMLGECTPLHDMHVSDCVLWCDWGRALEVWTGYKDTRISKVVFENIQIIRTTHIALDIMAWWGSSDTCVSDISFNNIVVEADDDAMPPMIEDETRPCYGATEAERKPHVPELFCAVVDNPGEEWKNYFPDSRNANATRRVQYRNIALRNIRYRGPVAPLPRIIVDAPDDVLSLSDLHLENIHLNNASSSPRATRAAHSVPSFLPVEAES